jgi:hypothetical protein
LTGKAPYKSTANLTTDDVTGLHSSVSPARDYGHVLHQLWRPGGREFLR